MATWSNVAKSTDEISEIDFLFSDASDFLFTDSTDFVFRELQTGLQYSNVQRSAAGTWTNVSKS